MLRRRICRGRAGSSPEQGQALVLFAIGLAGFLGLVAMSIDVGNLLVHRRLQQNAADSAALAAVGALLAGQTQAAAIVEAQNYASKHGYPGQVTVNIPPVSGPSAGDPNAVEVIIQRSLPKYFAQAVYSGPWDVSARAVAKMTTKQAGFGVVTLDPTRCDSLVLNSNALLTVQSGGVYVNSSCNGYAMIMNSNATATADTISIVGNFQGAANIHATPAPVTGQQPIPDPFASIPTPPIVAAPVQTPASCSFNNGNHVFNPGYYGCRMTFGSNTTATFNPGNYTFLGGMQLDSNVTITFGRGIYVMKGGGFQMNSNTTVNGPNGVLIYNTCNGPCGASGTFQLNSNAALNIKPYGAQYANISVWQDRVSNTPLQFNSNSLTAQGAIYSKAADIQYNSNATVPLQFVAANVQMNSNAKIQVDVGGLSTVPIRSMSLSE
jgi:hypothetical protein